MSVHYLVLWQNNNVHIICFLESMKNHVLSHDVVSGRGIIPCNLIDEPLVVYNN